jgi:hypothetical protein
VLVLADVAGAPAAVVELGLSAPQPARTKASARTAVVCSGWIWTLSDPARAFIFLLRRRVRLERRLAKGGHGGFSAA